MAPAAPAPVYKAPPPVVTAYNWTGFYVGINGGGAWGHEDWLDNNGFGGTVGLRPNGGEFGGQVGFRWQWNQLVLGIEGTWDWAGLRNSLTATPYTDELKIDSLYTATAQVGWAWDRVLIYAKGGWGPAPQPTLNSRLRRLQDLVARNSETVSGWTVGGGVDYAVWQNLILGVEYDHFDFEYNPFIAPFSTGGSPWIVTNTSRLTVDQVVARLSYKF